MKLRRVLPSAACLAALALLGCSGGGGAGPTVPTDDRLTSPPLSVAFPRTGGQQHYGVGGVAPQTAGDARQMPVYHDGRHLMVGVDQGAGVGRLAAATVRGDTTVRHGQLRDGVGADVLARYLSATVDDPALPEEIPAVAGADAGSLGPVEVAGLRILSDHALHGRRNLTCGANRNDFHLSGVTPGRDYQAEYFDLRVVQAGEACARCRSPLSIHKALEVGHIFKLGTKYSESMGATVLNSQGREVPVVMGSYGIGVERILAAAIESGHDDDGIIWPRAIAPFDCLICVVNAKDGAVVEEAEKAYRDLQELGVEVLLDDRKERPGVKFKDADLVGIPYRINFGSRKLAMGKVEWVERATGKITEVDLVKLSSHARSLLLADGCPTVA